MNKSGLPGEVEDDVARDTSSVDLLDVGSKSFSDACVLC